MYTKDTIENFVFTIENFNEITPAKQIDYFAYFLHLNNFDNFSTKDIQQCFEMLNCPKYSNISAYLNNNCSGKNKKFIKKSSGVFTITKQLQDKFNDEFNNHKAPPPSNNLFPIELVNETRGYIQEISSQAICCYDLKLFDACSVMLRKLIETLIIECFEKHKLDSEIKDKNGDFFYLSDLINKLLIEKSWNISRNAKQGFKNIKNIGDLAAHNRRFCAKQSDIDKIKQDVRICIQELISLIDYKNWK